MCTALDVAEAELAAACEAELREAVWIVAHADELQALLPWPLSMLRRSVA
ncbi:hypothetical protein ABZ371_02635 [Streptomyces sp. NPDC005899]